MTMLLQDLSVDELNQLLMLTRQFKLRFGSVASHMLEAASEQEIDESVARLSITCECLQLAAWMYPGSRELFLAAARAAIDDAERNRPRPEVGMQ